MIFIMFLCFIMLKRVHELLHVIVQSVIKLFQLNSADKHLGQLFYICWLVLI